MVHGEAGRMRFTRVDHGHADSEGKPELEAVLDHYEVAHGAHRASGMASCPFHDDRTPSFSWNTDRQLWKCHSCGRGGDSLTLIMEKEGIDFAGARALAASLALPTRDTGGGGGELSGSSHAGRRAVSPRPGNRPGRGGYIPAWRRR
ncbi:CHC2 zinc finger domain-containing protein [Streptomyces exfoliatus]|uniref:CHC2 zinc finger domain-containing protein n=1 Tax=Streptomyces exfoliatus TaxID=1905 RepID=UPI0037AD6FE0